MTDVPQPGTETWNLCHSPSQGSRSPTNARCLLRGEGNEYALKQRQIRRRLEGDGVDAIQQKSQGFS